VGNLQTTVEGNNLKISFPQKNAELKGKINCFRPSDQSKDFIENFKVENGAYFIPLNKFVKGKYVLKVEWSEANTSTTAIEKFNFYQEQVIVIP
jgi:hypothetical protein